MKCSNAIARRPYIPLNRPEDAEKPFICRVAPFSGGFEGEWLDSYCEGAHTLYVRARGEGDAAAYALEGGAFRVDGLENGVDYEFFIESAAGRKSNVRLARPGAAPEGATVINYLHPEDGQYAFSGQYLCSPSLCRLPDGKLIAGMDVYGGKMAQNLMILFASTDDGKTWKYLTDLYPFYWGSLFTHRGALYALGLTTEYGNLQIARSTDGGVSWTAPVALLYGSSVLCGNGGVHRGPMQVVPFGGRLYTTCEYGSWEKGSHLPAVISIDVNDDPLIPENWSCTGFLPFEGAWKEDCQAQADTMEGNIVVAPNGEMYEYLRWSLGKALVLRADPADPEAPLSYVRLQDMPVSNSMFRVLPHGDGYLLVTNRKTENAIEMKGGSYRNTLSLFTSRDLVHWAFLRDVVNRERENPKMVGFQYPCAFIEEDTLYLSVRCAYNGANSYHNSNTMLFWKLAL